MYNWKILWRHNIKTSNRASDISRKKAKFRGIFRGKFVEKSTDFAGFSREKSQNSRKNRLILRDFHGRKVKFRRIFRDKFLEKAADSTEMYLEIFLADFAEIPEFRGSATARNIRSPVLISFFPKAKCILILIIYLFMK